MPAHSRLFGACLVFALSGCVGVPPKAGAIGASGQRHEPSAVAGGVLVREQCSGCHSVEGSGASPMAAAPAFRDLAALYPVSDLQESLGEGMVTAHAAMPVFTFEPTQTADIIAYLESLAVTQP